MTSFLVIWNSGYPSWRSWVHQQPIVREALGSGEWGMGNGGWEMGDGGDCFGKEWILIDRSLWAVWQNARSEGAVSRGQMVTYK